MADKAYKFFGVKCTVGSVVTLKKLGQTAMLSDQLACDVISGGGAILPAETFDGLGFTKDEINSRHARRTETFLSKLREASLALIALRKDVRERGVSALHPKPGQPANKADSKPAKDYR